MQTSLDHVNSLYRFRISSYIRKTFGDGSDTSQRVLKQFSPDPQELINPEHFSNDPLSETHSDIHPAANLIHKYKSKVLVLVTSECPVFCRYCTRKRKTLMSKPEKADWLPALDYVKNNASINEVIFSGGDPFMLPVGQLQQMAMSFAQIKHVGFLRWHTRVVNTSPERVNQKLLDMFLALKEFHPQKIYTLVSHINLAEELTETVKLKFKNLQSTGLRLYNQSVLLKGINDDFETLRDLILALIDNQIQPYYLHQLDRVEGSSHFEVKEEYGLQLMQQLREALPAWAIPRYVRDSKSGKSNLFY